MNNKQRDVIALLLQAHGIDISMFDDSFLVKTIEKRTLATGNNSSSSYCNYLATNLNEANALVDSLNINYSEFFRNPLTFAYLEQIVLPELVEKKKKSKEKEIRIWSAACASGQEAYSIAILCDEIRERDKANIASHIFATDINQDELSKAQKGNYHIESLNKVSLKRTNTYFTRRGKTYTIAEKLQEHVDFSLFDLLSENGYCPPASIYGNFDLVFCSNLLFYYNPEHRQRILEKIAGSLASGGYMITGETEREIVKAFSYREIFVNSGIFKKN